MLKKRVKTGPKHGNILGIKITSTHKDTLIKELIRRIEIKDKFYIVTPNPEIVLMATQDWLLKKAIFKSDYSVPDGIGLAQAVKYQSLDVPKNPITKIFTMIIQGLVVGFMTLKDPKWVMEDLEIIKGRELFFDLLEIANRKYLRVYLLGGENGEQEKTEEILVSKYPNIVFKTDHRFPKYSLKGQPLTKIDRKLHKAVLGSIKMFEPDLVFVALGAPRQEKWIFRNFFRLKATGAMAVGGTFRFVSGQSKLPPAMFVKYNLEWLWRLITEPRRLRRIINAFFVFSWKIFLDKLSRV